MLSSKLDSIIFTLMSMIRIWRVSISVEDKYKYLHLKMGSCQIHTTGNYLPSSHWDNFSVRHFWKISTVLALIGCPLHLLSPTCTRVFSHKLFHVPCSYIARCKGYSWWSLFCKQNNEYATNDKSECICIIDQWALLIDKIYVTIYYLRGGNAIVKYAFIQSQNYCRFVECSFRVSQKYADLMNGLSRIENFVILLSSWAGFSHKSPSKYNK